MFHFVFADCVTGFILVFDVSLILVFILNIMHAVCIDPGPVKTLAACFCFDSSGVSVVGSEHELSMGPHS